MTEAYFEKCKKCRHNFKPNDCEPKCNMMCENHDCFEEKEENNNN